MVILLLVGIYWRKLVKYDKSKIFKTAAVGFVFALPILLSMFRGQTGRLTVFSIFSYPRPIEYLQAQLNQGGEELGSVSHYLYHPESVNYLRGIAARWFNHYSTRFLFFQGDWANQRHSAPNHGVLLLTDLVIMVFGIIALTRLKKRSVASFVWLWLILAPLPSVLSRDQIHAIRAYNMVIPATIVLALGISYILQIIESHKVKLRVVGYSSLFIVYFISIAYFLDAYFVHLPKHDSKYWEYGYKQMVEIVTPIQNNYERIRVQQSFAQPYIYFLFYQKYDPAKYQKQAELVDSGLVNDVGYQVRLDNIEFVPIDWSIQRGFKGVLFVADTIRIPPEDSSDESHFRQIADIKYLDGQSAFRIVEVKD